jgi:hypothetical protein
MLLVWLSGLSAAVLFAGIAWYLAPLKPGILALQMAFSPRRFGEVIHAWGPEHLERYRQHLPYDFALLLAYAVFGYMLATRTQVFASLPVVVARHAKWLLPLAAVCDAVEDMLHWWLTAAPRFGVPGVYAWSAGASLLKWVLLVGFGALVGYALAKAED